MRFRSHLDGSSHFFTPEHSMDVQIALGADIAMAFDECTEYPAERSRAEESLRLTMAWARRSLEHFRAHQHEVPWRKFPGLKFETWGTLEDRTPSIFGIVQGGMYPDLRRESAERLIEMDFDGYAIGGLSVGEPRELTLEIISEVLPLLPADKPRYVMGVGYPDEIEQYARMGVDMMDCVLPTRAARHALLFTSEGRINIKNKQYAEDQGPPDPNCDCMVCRRYSRAYLRHLMQAGETLSATLNTIHNLAYYLGIMRRVRADLGAQPRPHLHLSSRTATYLPKVVILNEVRRGGRRKDSFHGSSPFPGASKTAFPAPRIYTRPVVMESSR